MDLLTTVRWHTKRYEIAREIRPGSWNEILADRLLSRSWESKIGASMKHLCTYAFQHLVAVYWGRRQAATNLWFWRLSKLKAKRGIKRNEFRRGSIDLMTSHAWIDGGWLWPAGT